MQKLKNFRFYITNFPLIYSIIVLLFIFILNNVSVLFLCTLESNILENKNFIAFIMILSKNINTIITVFVFNGLKYYKRGNFYKTFIPGFLYILIVLMALFGSFADAFCCNQEFKTIFEIFLGILYAFTIGFFEESILRGLISNSFARKHAHNFTGVIKSIVYTNLIFGSLHMINIIQGVKLQSAILQSVAAFFIGCFLTIIYFRGGNLFVLIFIHTIIDMSGLFNFLFLNEDVTAVNIINQYNTLQCLTPIPFYLIYSCFLLRKSKIKEIIYTIKNINK